MPDQPTTARDIDLLNMLAAGRRAGMPAPIRSSVAHRTHAEIHLSNDVEAEQWETWWTRHGANNWHGNTNTDSDGAYTHHHRIGTWRDAEVGIVHLVPIPAEVSA